MVKRAYVVWSSWFDSHPYDREQISEDLRKTGAKNIRTSHALGWSNQPKVVTFDPGNVSMKTYQERVGEALGTQWIHVREMDWGGARPRSLRLQTSRRVHVAGYRRAR